MNLRFVKRPRTRMQKDISQKTVSFKSFVAQTVQVTCQFLRVKDEAQNLMNLKSNTELRAEPVTKHMATDLVTFTPDTPIFEAIRTLLEKRVSGAPVLNKNKELVGLIDDKDCLRVLVDSVYYNMPVSRGTVSRYMSNVMKTISEDANIIDVSDIFATTPYKRLLVIDADGKLKGQISRRDVLRAVQSMTRTAGKE